MEAREEAIAKAHPKTCDRAFEVMLKPWLSSHDSLFWITGKPGSGKSTLMKFLAAHPGK
jgi:ABC-type lipoprotein export system ATPase subunit